MERDEEPLFNVYFVRENVLSLVEKEDSVGIEKTVRERYTLLSMGTLL
jgi:hypothetical protein